MTPEIEERPEEPLAPGSGETSEAQRPDSGGSSHTRQTINNGHVNNQYNIGGSGPQLDSMDKLLQDLGQLPRSSHPYRHPLHAELVEKLDEDPIVVLTSDEKAAFVAGHALAHASEFADRKKRALFITRLQDKDRRDLDLMSVTAQVVREQRQVLLVEIAERCTFLEAILHTPPGALGNIRVTLDQHESYIVLVIDEDLLRTEDPGERIRAFQRWRVSHLQYLLSHDFAERAETLERRLLDLVGPLTTVEERRAQYDRITNWLAEGPAFFEKQLEELASGNGLALEVRANQKAVDPGTVLKEDSPVHKTAAFIAAAFPGISQNDFDRLVRLILRDETTLKEDVRHVFRRDGKLVTVRDRNEERCTDHWGREADRIFQDCALRTVATANGAWAVDFSESYLRADVRTHLNERHPWYLRQQCDRLQRSGVLFDPDLSPKAVEGLVRLFVERAIADPTGYGSIWLLDLVRGAHRSDGTEANNEATEAMLERLSHRLSDDDPPLLLNERLAILIREMADHDALRPVIRQFFEHLLSTKKHKALLGLILDVAPRLRYVLEFDPLIWMRRLLNEGNDEVRELTFKRLIQLARRAGPRIYEFLASLRSWLPREDRAPANYSVSERLAFNVPFEYCAEMSRWVTLGKWPSEHPLFYALPEEPEEARVQLAPLIEWLVDSRSAAFEKPDPADPLQPAGALRIGFVGDLVEHWAWVLEGAPSETPSPQGKALVTLILDELAARLAPRERTWLQRTWQRRQEELLKAAALLDGNDRLNFIARKTKLEQLRVRFARLTTATPKIPIQGEPIS